MALSSWVDCLVSIRFDLDIGPKIECITPPNAITEEGKSKLLRCAFPDCNPDCGYNFIFYFTMADCTTAAAESFSQTVAPPTTGNTVPELYGAAFYRQKHDLNVPRHYVQQVVVLLSHLPYYNVHELVLRVVAPRFCQCCTLSPDTEKVPVSSAMSPFPEAYFEVDQSYSPEHYSQEDVLRDAMQELAQWPSPHPQVRYSVNLLQQALVFLTPAHSLRQSIRATRSSCAAVRTCMKVDERVELVEVARGNARYRGSSFGNDVLPLFSLLGEQLHHLTYVWELLLRHEPLLILSNTPCVASATAFSVASLILPIQFNGTLRSYFTVQNEDFPRLSRMGKALPFPTNEALIVAGTNPFLLRSFSGWPSLLVVMDRNTANVVNGSVASPTSSTAASTVRENRSGGGGGGPAWHRQGAPVPPSSSFLPFVTTPTPQTHNSPTGLHAPSTPPMHGHHNSSFPVSPLPVNGEAAFDSCSLLDSYASAGGGGVDNNGSSTTTVASPLHADHHLHTLTTTTGPSSTASGVSLSGLVHVPTSKAMNGAAGTASATTSPTPEPAAAYQADPHATYALESSSDDVEAAPLLRSSTPASRPSSSAASAAVGRITSTVSDTDEQANGKAEGATAAVAGVHMRADSTNSTATGGSTAPVPLSTGSRRQEAEGRSSGASSASPAPITLPALSASTVTLFTTDNYKNTVDAVHAADYRKRGGGHQEMSRTNLQQRLHNYFDSSVHFLLNHAEQSNMLLKRLEMVSLLDADAQRTSVTLSLNQWQGSPTAVLSPWRRSCSDGATLPLPPGPSTGTAASPSGAAHFAKPASFQKHADPTAAEHGITSCSHFSVADDILRKFFTSLTTEFLTPVTAWFHAVTAPYTAFHLCDRALCDSLLSPARFLSDFALRHRETAPLMWTQLHSYKAYKVVYERFAHGCLFKAYVCQLIEEELRRQLDGFQIEEWVLRVPSEAERIDLLINLLSTIQRELNETLDPDVLFVTSATSVMASMAIGLREPHREQFMLKIGELKL
ncbi:hypothetical protein ABB37_05148 [Leptomonas pyrrhocoris]|uniref:UDENN domain-containing protein n=1 Tax=Leptomonas pyrrhocoris TaxID=157538 RepID=A0A0M9G181_LEPPY|nr:hypothetical protein ABB37_05148 [Leptomonas pyrrhocoris]KPA80163.1 hypothetical protein ABB37_05148 [Leptomonas pyrrhocoris]|eukprot:XP_015658602.1 hypothetical protein ABB37_05148 [Leptomonas pyrrhocoris]